MSALLSVDGLMAIDNDLATRVPANYDLMDASDDTSEALLRRSHGHRGLAGGRVFVGAPSAEQSAFAVVDEAEAKMKPSKCEWLQRPSTLSAVGGDNGVDE